MKTNHIPVQERLQRRINQLEYSRDAAHVPSHSRSSGNPYWMCKHCCIHDPELSIQGDHRIGCPLRGIEKQITHYLRLLEQSSGSDAKSA